MVFPSAVTLASGIALNRRRRGGRFFHGHFTNHTLDCRVSDYFSPVDDARVYLLETAISLVRDEMWPFDA